MSFVKINAITVPAESGDMLAQRFATRQGAVDGTEGFLGFELLQPTDERTTWLVVNGVQDPTHVIEVEESDVAAAVASLEQHEAYLAALPWHPKPEEFIPEILRDGGAAGGVDAGLPVRAHRVG